MSALVRGRWGWVVGLVAGLGPLGSEVPARAADRAPAAAAEETPAPAKTPAAKPKPAKEESPFLRIVRDKDGTPLAMQTSIVRYKLPPRDGKAATVDLIGAVHIGDRGYYEQLNKAFKAYDALLYELVAPEDHQVPKNAEPNVGHPIGAMQSGMSGMLELEHQLGIVNYRAKNFVHADMSPEEFDKTMEARGESFWAMMFRAMGHSMGRQEAGGGGPSDTDLLFALFSKDRALKLKRLMCLEFEDLEGAMVALEGPEGSTIITERNKIALDVLREQLEKGRRTLGIFYGAGHLPDMEERLLADFGAKRVGDVRWLTAWDMQPKPAAAPGDDAPPAPKPRKKRAADKPAK